MTSLHSRPVLLADLAHLVPADGLIVAATDSGRDPRYAAVRRVAIELARETDTCLLLLERASRSSPTGCDPETREPADDTRFGHLCPADPESERRHRQQLRDELAEAERSGVPTIVWTARGSGSHDLADVVARSNASLVLLPADPARRTVVRRVIRRTLEYYARGIDAPVVAVDETGATSLVDPLGYRSIAARRAPVRDVGWLAAAGLSR